MLVDERTAVAELVEAAVLRRVVGGAPSELHSHLGVVSSDLGGGVALAVKHDPSGYWSKAVGLGITERVTADLVAELSAFYAAHGGSRATVQIAPEALPTDWDQVAAAHDISLGSSWVKLLRPAGAKPPVGHTALRVGLAPSAGLAEWAHVLLEGLGMPHELDELFSATDDDAFRHVAAWDGTRMVAAATLFLDGNAGHLFGAATLPGYRGTGAQSALIALRLQEAEAAGVDWVVAETWEETPESPNSSFHNLVRAGFEPLYVRQNWVWQRSA